MGCWLGVDHGHKRVGIAAGSTEDCIATPITVLPARSEPQLFAEISRLAAEYDAEGLVVGWPINADDTEGPQGKKARQFAQRLAEATHLDVRLWDERLSSFQADLLLAGQMTRKKRRARQDALAAAEFLKDFLTQDGPNSAPSPANVEPEPLDGDTQENDEE